MRSIGFKNLKGKKSIIFQQKRKILTCIHLPLIIHLNKFLIKFILPYLRRKQVYATSIKLQIFFQSSSNLTPSRENAWCMPYRHEIWGGLEKSWRVKCRMNHLKSSATLACTCTNYLIAVSSQRCAQLSFHEKCQVYQFWRKDDIKVSHCIR